MQTHYYRFTQEGKSRTWGRYDFRSDLNSGRCLGLVRWPSQLHCDGGYEGNEKAGKLRMTGPDHSHQVKFPGPEASRGANQTRYKCDLPSCHESPFKSLYDGSPSLVPECLAFSPNALSVRRMSIAESLNHKEHEGTRRKLLSKTFAATHSA